MDKLIQHYGAWLQESLEVRDHDEISVINTPYLDPFNDYIQVYARHLAGEEWRLTDDGQTLFNLKSNGVDLATEKRKELFRQVVTRFDVTFEDSELTTRTTGEDFPWSIHSLIQSILAIGDLHYTSQPHVQNIFLEEVEGWLEEVGIRAVRENSLEGESGLTHRFDFVIPGSFDRNAPDRILDVLTTLTKQKVEQVMFSWQDIRPTRKAHMYALFNDTKQDLSPEKSQALQSYDITPLRWSERADWAEELAA